MRHKNTSMLLSNDRRRLRLDATYITQLRLWPAHDAAGKATRQHCVFGALVDAVSQKWPHFYFLNNSVKNKLIWIIFGTQNSAEIIHSLLHIPTTSEKCCHCILWHAENISFSTAAATGHDLRAQKCVFFTNESVNCSYPVNLQNNLIYTTVATKKQDVWVNHLLCMHPIQLSATS